MWALRLCTWLFWLIWECQDRERRELSILFRQNDNLHSRASVTSLTIVQAGSLHENKIRREKIEFEWFWTQIINWSYQLWRFLLVDVWPKTQSGSDNDDGEDKNDANDNVNGADYNKEGLRTLVDPKRIWWCSPAEGSSSSPLCLISSTSHWVRFKIQSLFP